MRRPRFTEQELREAVAAADSWAMTLRLLGMRVAGGNHGTVKKWAARWGISSEHFDAAAVRARIRHGKKRPLDEVLVENSSYNRGDLKRRLYEEGLKERRCELCGQGEVWRGKKMALILDHINGDAADNRLENLRIACPNCAATFDTHCGRNANRVHEQRACAHCGNEFRPKYAQHRYCSHACSRNSPALQAVHVASRKVERPPYDQLVREVRESGYSAVGRKYGVSDNAIRKWVRAYQRELRRAGWRSHRAVVRPLGRGAVWGHVRGHCVPDQRHAACEEEGREPGFARPQDPRASVSASEDRTSSRVRRRLPPRGA